ncbi:Putative Endonuclease/exonuclease/phosphatase superfamily [Septoria linicola]|uniref:Endonuclease/exonuclease/phosphatase superfamily n=1 Tax=Septoria linicola TaxID=215465 RepID=A0A9Q9AVH4_9PEZI|nr:putative Endonuclease/exonuclease/phosphatase superfamily [Septoria linicola]USW52858.1 Putative Endonuclease/exonuclease/phosphatase superfamily [Septoria linicola]
MGDLNCHVTTFNAGREEIHIDYFASSLHTSFKSGMLPPDLIVLALQEIAPIGFSFLGGSLLAPYFSRFAEAVYRATQWKYGKDADYEHVLTRNVGMTGIMVFARQSTKSSVQWIEEAGTGVGLWEMGNKGAVAVRLGFEDDVVVTFVAAHLAPMEEAWERRNEDWRNICKTLVFEPIHATGREGLPRTSSDEQDRLLSDNGDATRRAGGGRDLFDPSSYIFFAGDLNYRSSDQQPDPKDFEKWPQPMATDSDPTHYSQLLKQDQLTRELQAGRTLHHLSEAPIAFPPTYKYSSKAMSLVKSNAEKLEAAKSKDEAFSGLELDNDQEQVWLWAKHRMPSWCDRILFLADAPPKVQSYDALPIQPTSDHRPVALTCSIPRKAVRSSGEGSRFTIDNNWQSRRAWARRYELAVGLGAYLTLTGQGEALLAGTVVGIVGGYFVLAALLGYY